MALMPLVTQSGVSAPLTMYLAALAESSKMLIWLMAIWFPFAVSLRSVSVGSSFMEMPIAGRKYVVSKSSFKLQPSWTALFGVCGIPQELFLLEDFL